MPFPPPPPHFFSLSYRSAYDYAFLERDVENIDYRDELKTLNRSEAGSSTPPPPLRPLPVNQSSDPNEKSGSTGAPTEIHEA